jgi:hypothetical protein
MKMVKSGLESLFNGFKSVAKTIVENPVKSTLVTAGALGTIVLSADNLSAANKYGVKFKDVVSTHGMLQTESGGTILTPQSLDRAINNGEVIRNQMGAIINFSKEKVEKKPTTDKKIPTLTSREKKRIANGLKATELRAQVAKGKKRSYINYYSW